ncbi:MAG TPA: UDP-N-acetylmuramoyl-L-alanine--D-glutamate ligase [Anaerolineales bacterium]|nr:UDP-N-acetylmuramoyl-L-alanine--D-glutamate ligase [Anaerolineales bacterium]
MDAWRGRRVVVVGLARQGKAVARHALDQGANVVITDLRPAHDLVAQMEELAGAPVEYFLGGHPPEAIAGADLLCLSGGVPADLPLAQQARRLGIAVTNDSQLFLEGCPAPTIGITGSAGKTTTTALLGEMARRWAERSGRRAWVGGNIGRPLLADLGNIRAQDLVVMELSSFQLEVMTRSPAIAVLLNLTPNHLDRHRTMEAYRQAKARILDFQSADDLAVLGAADDGAWALRSRVRGRLAAFAPRLPQGVDGAELVDGEIVLRRGGQARTVGPRSAIRLRGEHNLMNVLAACAAAAGAGIPESIMAEAIAAFAGVPHRLTFVRRVGQADWYNDSIATTPERSLAAIRSFEEPLVLLAGGRDKDLTWDEFGDIVRQRVDHLVLFGEAAEKIAAAVGPLPAVGRLQTIDRSSDLHGAIELAARRAQPGDVVLLAPGGTSFDEFRDFAERGDRFEEWVREL